jgi:hypothetical protein
MPEDLDAQKFLSKTKEFMRIGPRGGVNNFVVRGEVRDLEIEQETLVCLFPHFLLPGESAAMVLEAGPEARPTYYYSEILDLEIPTRVKRYGIRDDKKIKKGMINRLRRNGMPYIALGFGHYLEEGKRAGEVVLLSAAVGFSPETALAELKMMAQKRLADLQ